jgi:hypothetical protein
MERSNFFYIGTTIFQNKFRASDTLSYRGEYALTRKEQFSFLPERLARTPQQIQTQIIPHQVKYRAGIFQQSIGARKRVGIGLSYRPVRLHRLAEFVPWNRFLGSINI